MTKKNGAAPYTAVRLSALLKWTSVIEKDEKKKMRKRQCESSTEAHVCIR